MSDTGSDQFDATKEKFKESDIDVRCEELKSTVKSNEDLKAFPLRIIGRFDFRVPVF